MKAFALLVATLSVTSMLAACSDPGPEAYPTYQECFTDHFEHEALPPTKAIVVCCLEHPINGISPACGDTKPDCINYLTANLNQTSASTTEVSEACDDYITQMAMP